MFPTSEVTQELQDRAHTSPDLTDICSRDGNEDHSIVDAALHNHQFMPVLIDVMSGGEFLGRCRLQSGDC